MAKVAPQDVARVEEIEKGKEILNWQTQYEIGSNDNV